MLPGGEGQEKFNLSNGHVRTGRFNMDKAQFMDAAISVKDL